MKTKQKIFILDTNVVLSAAEAIYKFEAHDVVIPISVIQEMDNFKKDLSETGRNARQFSRILDEFRARGSLTAGVPISPNLENTGNLIVDFSKDIEQVPLRLENNVDNQIISIALKLKSAHPQAQVIVISKDTNLRIKADVFGLTAEDFEADKVVQFDELYSGHEHLEIENDVINKFYQEQKIDCNDLELTPHPHQFYTLNTGEDNSQEILTRYNAESNALEPITRHNDGIWGIYPKNREQSLAMDILLNDDIRLVTLFGAAGTGKTLLAVASGLLKTTDEGVYNKLLVSRPIFPMGKDIGFLPGSVDEKLNPWMQPIYDNLDLLFGIAGSTKQKRLGRTYNELINQGLLEIEPLTYIRGRSLPNVFLIVDEAQNLTPHEIKTILTRAGENTKIILTGDPYQIDNPYLDSSNNGMTHVIDRFKSQSVSGHITLKRGERSGLASLAAKLL